ncbi:uncharacterized protein [Drosophila virilis]|uniref:Uncharacterized protein n=1 Tax=Drosophila virilis TaxID=7244 RepID=B4M250_DROVI|nr:uncharacterized protein LOC6631566 [Drosophila virilis]EDW65754.2 uncharacterized protein Dvir_GJ19425 [Drosophila virilis]
MHNIRQPQERLLLVLMICACACSSTSARPSEVKLQSQYLRAISAYRRLERSLPPQELRALIGLGLLNGARQTNEQMEQHLVQAVKELIQTDKWQSDKVLPKIDAIEQQMERDQYALNILSNAMDVLCNDKNEQEFRQEVYNVFKEQQHFLGQQSEVQPEVGTRLGQLRCHILQQFSQMKTHLDAKIERTLDHLVRQATVDGPLAKASHKILHKRAANEKQTPETPTQDSEKTLVIKADLPEDDFRQNLVVDQSEKSGESGNQTHPKNEFDSLDNVSQTITVKPTATSNAKQEDDSSSELGGDDGGTDAGGGGGGLVGIIGSLSGGEGGSDVGALIGALTGVISTLFGPGGLDIEALISTATSLLSGLLSGNKNFGVVLGQYVGTALDGLSGGGGAINNGQFLGNFVGTVLASLSADPEDEGPPQPLTFTKNFLSSFLESKFRPAEAPEERHGSGELPRQKKKESLSAGFNSEGFVQQIASHLVSSVLGLLLNASLGASGGASHASTGVFSSSSHHTKT